MTPRRSVIVHVLFGKCARSAPLADASGWIWLSNLCKMG